MSIGYFFAIFVLVSVISIRLGMLVMYHFGILDHPGGHKQHAVSTPFVGGFGVLTVLISAIYCTHLFVPNMSLHPLRSMALGGVILFLTGLADDIWRLNFRTRLVIEASVAMVMIYLGGVELWSLGQLVFENEIELGWLAVPFTVFATVGLINALNMIDGIDGMSGALSFISLGFVAVLAGLAGNQRYLLLTIAVMGGVAGFLYFNLRYPSNRRAKVFLGDNGSMLLGFVFAWLFIALSQGEQKAMTPVTALWLFSIPLMDTLSVMLRRIWRGKSPFQADRNHLHHLFLRAGYRVSDTVWIVSLVQIVFGTIGIAGLRLDLPEQVMFGLFIAVFSGYLYLLARPEWFVPELRRMNLALGLPCVFEHGVFVGYFQKASARELLDVLAKNLGNQGDYRISLRRLNDKELGARNIYGMVEAEGDDEASIANTRRLMTRIRAHLGPRTGVQVHLLMHRNSDNDRRQNSARQRIQMTTACARKTDRREVLTNHSIFSTTKHKGRSVAKGDSRVEYIHSAFSG